MSLRQRVAPAYDIVIYGATGFTGSLAAFYLASHPLASKLKWAIAGRSQTKLNNVINALLEKTPAIKKIDTIVVDSTNATDLKVLANKAKVILTTVGPFSKYGELLVAACVAAGTDYCDLTGEPWFVKKMISSHHAEAQAKGVKIVHSSGFDSIPSDIGTLFMVKSIRKKFSSGTKSVHCSMLKGKGGFSGGTVSSGLEILALPISEQIKLCDPYYLNDSLRGLDRFDLFPFFKSPKFGWQGAFVMEGINSKIVRRSVELNGDYGNNFSYSETMTGTFLVALISTIAIRLSTLFAIMFSLLPTVVQKPLMSFFKKIVPAPGTGPSEEAMATGFWEMGYSATAETGQVLTGYCKSYNNDPGYKGTAKMLVESGICLALFRDKCTKTAGVGTPASCIGEVLIDRLQESGIAFTLQQAK